MAIEKNSFRVSMLDLAFRVSMLSEGEEELQRDSDNKDEFNDCDFNAGSDELGETGEECCQIGDEICSIPFDLYDLSSLGNVLSINVWNEFLTEEERFNLTKYLPDMDQETFMWTLKELFAGSNLYFGSPITKLFGMLKGGLCEPRVALYRQGLKSFQKRQHYHLLRKHQNSMVTSLYQMRGAWRNCRGYSLEEKLHVLNAMKSQKSLMYENMEVLESEEGLWSEKLTEWRQGLKVGHHSGYETNLTLGFPSRGRAKPLEKAKVGKRNPNGPSKLPWSKTYLAKELGSSFPSVYNGGEMKSFPNGSLLAALRQKNKAAGYDLRAASQLRNDNEAEETVFEVDVQRDRNFSQASAWDRAGHFKMGKKHEVVRVDEHASEGFPNSLRACVGNMTVNKLSDIKVLTVKPSNARISYDCGKKVKHLEKVQQFPVEGYMKFGKSRAQNLSLKESWNELSDGGEPCWHNKAQGEVFSVDPSSKYCERNVNSKKWRIEEPSDVNINDRFFHSKYKVKPSQEKMRAISIQNGDREMGALRSGRSCSESEETESDSSDQIDEDGNHFVGAYHHGILQGSVVKSGSESKKAKPLKKDKKDNAWPLDRVSHSSRKMADLGVNPQTPPVENYFLKENHKAKDMHDSGRLQNYAAKLLEDSYFSGSGRLNGDTKQNHKYEVGKDGRLQDDYSERLRIPSLKAHPTERKQKGEVGLDYYVYQSNYLQVFVVDEESLKTRQLAEGDGDIDRLAKKGKVVGAHGNDGYERSEASLSLAKKRKIKAYVTYDERDDNGYMHSHSPELLDTSLRKRRKRKLEDDSVTFELASSEQPVPEMEAVDLELKPRLHKKPFTLITPTVHSGFSFSIIHLLSAVRMAMITMLPEDIFEAGKHLDKNDGRQRLRAEQDRKQEGAYGVHLHENLDINKPGHSTPLDVPSLTVQEIVNRVRSNPRDPWILETQEPLQDLVGGVLKIFSSKTAPLGAKGWKPIVYYEKSTKRWSWIDPVPHSSSDHEAIVEVTSPEAWSLPHKMLVKLVDAFANWLKSGQETLQQMGSLPPPPSSLMQFNLDEGERFRDLRAHRSLTTISPSSEEVRTYFRREEVLRYSIPDRAFSYTAVDGRKSFVAPLRRCGGKPTSKVRDHFMLKCDRPPHVSILCLVRDAAARLPGSIGTRSDVCTLIRDSQYIVHDVSDAQVNHVVSGALDRLHYELDPCVQFDGERKLWVYLHREREEEDFEDDGTSSRKKWKRPKKEAAEPFEQETATVAYHGAGEVTGFDLISDLNAEPSCTGEDKKLELMYYDGSHSMDEHVETSHGSK